MRNSFCLMKIVSWNVNGLRSVYNKGFLESFKKLKADILCLQEIKIQKDQITSDLLKPLGYHSFFNFGQKRGHSGVAVYSLTAPKKINSKLGFIRFDQEGRLLELEFDEFILINLYIPHGGRQKENLAYKLEVYDYLLPHLKKFKNKKVILIGDFNIAHEENDLARPKQNMNNIMFTKKERKELGNLIKMGFVDSFRMFNKEGGNYTWWPYFANARQRNLGWRIDYAFLSAPLLLKLENAFIITDNLGSDHCPIGIEVLM